MFYDPLVFPSELISLTREIRNGVPTKAIPAGWHNIIVYHPHSQSYYVSKSKDPAAYEKIVRERQGQRWELLGHTLKKLLTQHPEYQFFVTPINARPMIEAWLASTGRKRVATSRGEVVKEEHVLFRVYSNQYNVERFVCAPKSTPHDKVIQKANIQLARWLRTPGTMHQHERESMRIALHSKFRPNSRVFSPQDLIYPHRLPADVTFQNVSAYTAERNLQAVRDFITSTVTGRPVPARPL